VALLTPPQLHGGQLDLALGAPGELGVVLGDAKSSS
jgi:hypothetical protein